MADDSKPNNFANNSIILAALISTGALIFQNLVAPLQNARPPADVTQLHEAASAQDLDARLWQDPFAVVANVESDFAHAGDCTDKHGVNHCLKPDEQLKAFGGLDPDDQPDIFWVTMSGAPYFAEEEERRRIRYAVVSALNVRGFAPFDPTHTGYYRHRKPPSYIIPIADKPEGSGDFFPQNAIPFDLFEERAPTTAKPHKIIVAWVNEDLLGRNPLVQLRKLKEEIRP